MNFKKKLSGLSMINKFLKEEKLIIFKKVVMEKRLLFLSVCAISIAMLVTSCVKDTINVDDIADEANRSYEFAGPLGNMHLTMKDFLEENDNDSVITVDEDGNLFYKFSEEYPFEIDNVYTLEDVAYTWTYSPITSLFPTTLKSTAKASLYDDIDFKEKITMTNEEGVRLDSMYIKSANLALTGIAPAELVADIVITLPQVTKQGEPLSAAFKVGQVNGDNRFNIQIPLSEYKIVFEKDTENPSGAIDVNIKFRELSAVIDPMDPRLPDPVEINFYLSDVEPDVAFGYFSSRALDIEAISLEFDAFEEMNIDALFEFGNIWVDFKAESTIGVPFEVNLDGIAFKDNIKDETKLLVLDNNSFSVDAATYGIPLQPAFGETTISGDNSNILDFRLGEFKPNVVTGNVVARIKDADESKSYFISQDSKVKTTVDVAIPLWFKTEGYARIDTIDFNYNEEVKNDDGEDKVTDNFEKGTLHFKIKNAFPFELKIQAHAMDADYNIVESLFEDEFIKIDGPKVDTDGLVLEPTEGDFTVELTGEQLQRFKDEGVMYIFIETFSVTSEEGAKLVKIKEDNYCDISLAIEASGAVN